MEQTKIDFNVLDRIQEIASKIFHTTNANEYMTLKNELVKLVIEQMVKKDNDNGN